MEQSSKLNRFARKFSLGVLLFSLLLNTAILQAQNAPKPKRTVIEVDVSKADSKFNNNTVRCFLMQFKNPLTHNLVANGQIIGEKKFKIVLDLTQCNVFDLNAREKNGDGYGIADLFLEPGDSISIIPDGDGKNDYTKYTGKGANNNPFDRSSGYPVSSKEFSKEFQNFWLNKVHKIYKDNMSNLEKRKSFITTGYYNFLFVNYTYDLYNAKLYYIGKFIKESLDSASDNREKTFEKVVEFQKRIFPELFTKALVNDSFIHVQEYREFIDDFMRYQSALKLRTYFYNNLPDPNSTKFELAKQLPPKTSEFYTALLIKRSLILPDKKEAVAPLLKDYLEKYPNSVYKDTLENLFNSRGNIGINKPVPDFTLKNEKGQSVSLSSFKGKPACLVFYDNDETQELTEIVAENAKAFPELNLIFVYCGTDTSKFNIVAKKFPYAKNLLNFNWKSAKEYNIYLEDNFFCIYLIDQNGLLVDYNKIFDDYTFYKLIHQSKASSNKSGIWGLIGIIAGITATLALAIWLLFRWRIRYIRKREEKKRKQIEIELRGIRAQMNPHFMFNSLGSIQNLINQSKVQEANLYLSKFAGLMRLILNNSEKEFVPLAGEIDAIRTYCELEQLRFGFEYNIDVESNIDIFNTEIPGMLIQPYVENAILHGINYLEDRAGKLDISFKMENNQLVCTINDNGIGRKASQALKSSKSPNGNGFGLRLSRERIDLLKSQGKQINLNIIDKTNEKGEAEGTTVEIKMGTND